MYTITHSPSKNGFVLNNSAPRPKSAQYELLRQGEKVGIKETASNEYVAAPMHFTKWNDGIYSTVDELLTALDLFVYPANVGGDYGNYSGEYVQEIINSVKIFENKEIKELSFQVLKGTAQVTIGGNTIEYPLENDIKGYEGLTSNLGLNQIIITPSLDSLVVLMYKTT
tara:strand:- start:467 stop:973 length:507 start_codon:yes stop_codon:yes gene_type:complete